MNDAWSCVAAFGTPPGSSVAASMCIPDPGLNTFATTSPISMDTSDSTTK
ncbi:hypothetical protein [Amycolatopsis sp. FDAARGOS 1241]|nr:hypothetical protein [Amycolatopsis sp. FDAARGOS 1241]